MIVSMWMTRQLITIGPDTPIIDASELMATKRIRRLPVVTEAAEGPHLVGIVSATDILHAYPPTVNPFRLSSVRADLTPGLASDIMRRQLTTVSPETPIDEAATTMRDLKIGGLPVINGGRLVGLITESDIFKAFVSIFEARPRSVRITFDVSKNDDIFGLIAALAVQLSVRVVSLFSSQQDGRPIYVVQLTGDDVDKLLDRIWDSGHHVLNVIRSA